MSNQPAGGFAPLNVPNTFALSCHASRAIRLSCVSDLEQIQSAWDAVGEIKFVGAGSNLLLPPTIDTPLVIMALRGTNFVGQTPEHWLIDVAAGENWHDWVAYSVAQGWPGLENLALIPGTVGASPVQNIGAYGVEVCERIEHVRVWDFERREVRELTREECQFGYRDSLFKTPEGERLLILGVRFALPKAWQPALQYPDLNELRLQAATQPASVTPRDVMNRVIQVRQAKLPDPDVTPNVGSFFKNPVVSQDQARGLLERYPNLVAYPQALGAMKLAAGWLIDQCGWKGRKVGSVRVHERQALVLVNDGGATLDEVLAVAANISGDVREAFGVELEIEPVRWA